MTDPKRWLDDAGFASSLERELVLSGKQLAPPEGAVSRGWAELAPLLGPGPGTPGGSDPSGPSSAGLDGASGPLSLGSGASSLSTGTIKAFIVGAALGVGVMGVVQATRTPRSVPNIAAVSPVPEQATERAAPHAVRDQGREPEPGPEPATPGSSAEPALAAVPAPLPPPTAPAGRVPAARVETQGALAAGSPGPTPLESVGPPPEPPPLAEPSPAAGAGATPAGGEANAGPAPSSGDPRSANWLRAEAQDMARAKNWVASGRAAEALVLLQNAADRFAGGALTQEREALIVEALFGSGRTEQGRARARAFVQKYPNSPMSERMRRLERGAP